MRRALTALIVTAVVTVLLVNFKTRPAVGTLAAATSGSSAAGTAARRRGPRARRSRAAAPATRAAPAPASAPARPRTVVGPTVQTPYGPVQVAATVLGRQLERVRALVLPSGNPQTDAINSQAGPLLDQEAMAAQSAGIDTISGASYTSEAYRRSLQAAIDRAVA